MFQGLFYLIKALSFTPHSFTKILGLDALSILRIVKNKRLKCRRPVTHLILINQLADIAFLELGNLELTLSPSIRAKLLALSLEGRWQRVQEIIRALKILHLEFALFTKKTRRKPYY